ncbi:hypothetical protein CEP52_013759 [Fusarium oligoseptatum]|uniref:Heterokaryon incompatibility domain-containing protein n=1 Tax=Fusarium oligoseptatum TaxID=2604345 RepID=A0A428SRU7_9HYPO|nr:hypothetical protein CEP52_013759 [Fusarium oligoseptatum]
MNEELYQTYAGEILEEEDSFRLISLQPGDNDEPLILRLINTRLQDPQPYEAVSYVWGDASRQVLVRVVDRHGEEITMGVTPNCYAALQRLRKKDSARTLWIDSICINQSLNAEKNHQLMLMARIYQEATQVVVYLGEGTSDTDAAMKYIGEVDDPSDFGSGDWHLQSAICDKSSLDVFFERPWFHRVWVLQEITFAKQAIVVCGSQELDWQSFLTFYQWNVINRSVDKLPYLVQYSTSPVSKQGSWIWYVERLFKMLRDTRHCGATDPRDKLYAIIPLLNRDHDQLSVEIGESMERWDYDNEDEIQDMQARREKTPIPVDYGRSEKAVFTDLAVLLLQTVGLDVLTSVIKQPRIPGLPSWVPDWSSINSNWSSSNPPREMGYAAGFDGEPDYLFGRSRYKPERLQTWTVSEYLPASGETSTQLHIDVVRVGRITKLGDACDIENNVFPLAQWESLVPSKEYLESRKPPAGLSTQEMMDFDNGPKGLSPFVRTVSGDDVVYPRVVTEAVEFIKLYDTENLTKKQEEAKKDNIFWNESQDKDKLPLRDIFKKGSSYETQANFILRMCDGKRFFVTDTGFIGLAPERAQVGDVVDVVNGASVPFVFRRISSKETDAGREGRAAEGAEAPCFELVGESFAFGVMTGSIWRDVVKGTKQVEKIIVR